MKKKMHTYMVSHILQEVLPVSPSVVMPSGQETQAKFPAVALKESAGHSPQIPVVPPYPALHTENKKSLNIVMTLSFVFNLKCGRKLYHIQKVLLIPLFPDLLNLLGMECRPHFPWCP